jgi:hypothetical protein
MCCKWHQYKSCKSLCMHSSTVAAGDRVPTGVLRERVLRRGPSRRCCRLLKVKAPPNSPQMRGLLVVIRMVAVNCDASTSFDSSSEPYVVRWGDESRDESRLSRRLKRVSMCIGAERVGCEFDSKASGTSPGASSKSDGKAYLWCNVTGSMGMGVRRLSEAAGELGSVGVPLCTAAELVGRELDSGSKASGTLPGKSSNSAGTPRPTLFEGKT